MHQPPARPNVVLVNVDQWRGDALGVEGHPVVSTPYLDQFAIEGVRCARAYAATPVCIPARASLYTGLTPRTHGRVGYRDGVAWPYPVTIAGEFTRHGYQTQAIGKLHVFPARNRFGFEHVILHDGYLHATRKRWRGLEAEDDYLPWLWKELGREADYFEHGLNCNSIVARPWDKPERLHPTNFVVTMGLEFLRRRDPTRPFFLFLSFHRPHPPYDPPAWAFEQYLHEPMPEPPLGDWLDAYGAWANPRRPDAFVGNMDARAVRRARAGYYGSITHIDHQINRFLEGLQEADAHANTYVCFVSDHGEMLGDHHLWRKGYPYEGSARIPLLLKGPWGGPVRRNAVLPEVVELRDVMPTLLDCAGLPIPRSVEGKSFLPLARGKRIPWRKHLHGELTLFNQSLQWLTDGHEKYVWFSGSGREQLFDLDADPQELHDRAAESPARTARWRKVLIKELRGREEGFTDGRRLVTGRKVNAVLKHLRKAAGLE